MNNNKNSNNTTSVNNKKRKAAPKPGVDAALSDQGKGLAVGQSVRFRLIKGPSVTTSGDPVDSKAPWTYFPLIAKFGESVQRPDFTKKPWQTGRFYEQEVPKPDDSDEEDADGDGANGDGPSQQQQPAPKKKRWRYGDGETPRQWILQEDVDFYQTFIDRKEQKTTSSADKRARLSSRYEGTAEHNPSQYALIRLHHDDTTTANQQNDEEYLTPLQVCLLPAPNDTNANINFAQPAARKTYSLTEAEHVISDQRMGLIKSFHHMEPQPNNHSGEGEDGEPPKDEADAPPPPPRNILALRKKAAHSSKGRLLSKLKQQSKTAATVNDEEEGDDVMGDVAFRSRKGAGAARKELLSTVGEVKVSDDGVLGGANDAVFGGRQRFAQFQESTEDHRQRDEAAEGAGGKGDDEDGRGGEQNKERGGDGAAMEDDFYQRDVKAEYDELDYDANEQFDDDDVDLGEAEQMIDNSGFKDDDVDEDDMDDDEDEDDEDLANGGVEGLASLAGFKALLAKARGEETEAPMLNKKSRYDNGKKKQQLDHMSKIIAADEKARLDAERKAGRRGGASAAAMEDHNAASSTDAPAQDVDMVDDQPAAPQPTARAPAAETANLLDANGMRVISLEAVRREIWLNHGSIPMKRLMKIFEVKKKSSQDRQDKFREVVKELCTMKNDPVSGRMLVLKQHYSKG